MGLVAAASTIHPLTRRKIITMVKRPPDMNSFEFVVVSALRTAQLQRGCTPRVAQSAKVGVTAQHEVAERKVLALHAAAGPPPAATASAPSV